MRALLNPRQDLGAIEPDGFLLIFLSCVDIHDGRAAVEKLVDCLGMLIGITADGPFRDDIIDRNLALGCAM